MRTQLFCGRHPITTILILIIISFPVMSTSELADNLKKPLVLRGVDEPKSTLLMHNLRKNLGEEKKEKEEANVEKAEIEMAYKFGEGGSEEEIDKIFKENVRKIFENSKWIFSDNKKSFIFNSSQFNANGDYSITDNIFEFHGQSITGAIFTLDGFIRPQQDDFVLDVIYTVSLKGRQQIGRVSQMLHQEVQAPTPPAKPVEIKGILVPSSYKIELIGTTDGQEFGPLAATLDISASPPGDSKPFQIMLTSHPLNAIGCTSWFSVILPREKDKGLSSEITTRPGPEVELKLKSDAKIGWAATWDTVDKDLKISGINATARIKNGTLIFSIQGDRITGEIHAAGESWHGRSSDYQAKFTGQRQEPGLMSAESTDDERLREYTPMSIDKTVDIGGVPVPSVFEVKLTGKTEAQSFGPLSAKLLINESEPGDSSPFSIILLTDGPSKNGSIAWISIESVDPQQESKPASNIHAQNGKVSIELNPSKAIMNRGLYWFTLKQKESFPDDTTIVYPEKLTLEFSVQGDHISGTISASGLLATDFKQSGTYEAELIGRRQKSEPVEELQKMVGVSKFDGVWDTDSLFKQIILQGYQKKLNGKFQGLQGGTLEGTAESDSLNPYFNFTWHSKTNQQGWGFLRALPAGGTLAGLWGYRTDRTESRVLIATQQPLSLETQSIETPQDLLQLRYLGIDLADQGKCEQAVKVLEKAWKIYHEKRPQRETAHLEKTDYLLGEARVLEPLINCYSKLGNYDKVVEYLVYAVEVRSLLGPKESAKRLFEQRVGEMVPSLERSINAFKILQDNLPNLNKGRIGIDFEQNERTNKIVVTAVTKDAPAYTAGIQPKDIIIGIDDHSIEGMNLRDVFDRISGSEGTQVRLTIVRGDKQIDFTLTRQRLKLPVSASRETEINNLIGFFSNYFQDLLMSLTSGAERLTALEDEINKDRRDPIQELLTLKDQLANQGIQVNFKRDQIIASGENFFKDQQQLLQNSRELIHLGSSKNIAKMSEIDPRETEAMENKMMESLEKNDDLNWAEKALFKEYYINALLLNSLAFELDTQSNFIKRWQLGENLDAKTEQTREAALRLSNSIEDWRNQLKTDMGKITALNKGQPFFRSLIKLLWNMNGAKEALEASEAARTRAFLDLMAGRVDIQKSLEQTSAKTTLLNPISAPPITYKDIQEIVQQRQSTTIEYFLLDDQVLIWVLSPTGKLATISSPVGRQELEQAASEFDKFVNASVLSTSDRIALSTLLNKLYNQLIKPIEIYLPVSENETITIVPHDQLFHIPFGALVTNLADNNSQQPKYLIEKHPLVYSPSIALLRYTQQNKERVIYPDKPNLLALVNPKPVSGYEQSISEIDLKITEKHFNEILQFYPNAPGNEVFSGEEATQEVLQKEVPRFNVLYLASHAKAFEERPLESYIALSKTPFTVPDVFKLDLHTDLVILGACETGRGKITGDGVNGFSRAFTWAGTPSLLISLWTIPEEQTLNQMYKFHEYWRKQGMTKAQALRMAQVNSLHNYPDQPNVWAGFILFGEYQ